MAVSVGFFVVLGILTCRAVISIYSGELNTITIMSPFFFMLTCALLPPILNHMRASEIKEYCFTYHLEYCELLNTDMLSAAPLLYIKTSEEFFGDSLEHVMEIRKKDCRIFLGNVLVQKIRYHCTLLGQQKNVLKFPIACCIVKMDSINIPNSYYPDVENLGYLIKPDNQSPELKAKYETISDLFLECEIVNNIVFVRTYNYIKPQTRVDLMEYMYALCSEYAEQQRTMEVPAETEFKQGL